MATRNVHHENVDLNSMLADVLESVARIKEVVAHQLTRLIASV